MNSPIPKFLICESLFIYFLEFTPTMEFVCSANLKGEFDKNIHLRELHKNIPNSKPCNKPYIPVVKDMKDALILFSNGKFRTMGCIDELEASFLAFSYLPSLSTSFLSITL